MKDEQRIKVVEEELKVLKNEVKAVLLDLREQYLNIQNPFNQNMVPSAGSKIAGIDPAEQEERQPRMDSDEIKDSVAVDSSKAPPQIKVALSQMPAPQLLNPLNDVPCLWPRPEAGNEEEFPEELLTNTAPALNKKRRKPEFPTGNGKVDLVVIAGLTQWLEQATARLGKDRTEVLVEISFAMGRLPENLKDALTRMARLSHHESPVGQSITASDYLSLLAQLENLLAGSKEQDNAILSILSMMKDTRNG